MLQLVAYRHGETEHNRSGVISGRSSDPVLTAVGKEQARKLGSLLRECFPEAGIHYCSDLKRAEETARLALGNLAVITPSNAFGEIDHGLVDGKLQAKERNKIWAAFVKEKVSEWKEAHPNEEIDPFFKWTITPFFEEKAETFMQLWKRVSAEIIHLSKRYDISDEVKTATIGCHNAVMQVLIMMSQAAQGTLEKDENGLYPMFFERNLLPNGAVAIFEVDPSNEKDPIHFSRFVEAGG